MKIDNLNSRRSFIKKISGGIALSSFAISSSSALSSIYSFKTTNKRSDYQNPVRIGIIGGSVNAHTYDYGKLFNIDKKFPGVELLYAWADKKPCLLWPG